MTTTQIIFRKSPKIPVKINPYYRTAGLSQSKVIMKGERARGRSGIIIIGIFLIVLGIISINAFMEIMGQINNVGLDFLGILQLLVIILLLGIGFVGGPIAILAGIFSYPAVLYEDGVVPEDTNVFAFRPIFFPFKEILRIGKAVNSGEHFETYFFLMFDGRIAVITLASNTELARKMEERLVSVRPELEWIEIDETKPNWSKNKLGRFADPQAIGKVDVEFWQPRR